MDAIFDADYEKPTKDKRTFYQDDLLPSLPLPSVHQTIEKYLDSCKALLTDEEYRKTEEICKNFMEEESMDIQVPLMRKAVNERNWMEKWWNEYAYLKVRSPIMYYYFAGPGPYLHNLWPFEDGTQLERSAIILYSTMLFWKALKSEILPQHKAGKGSYMTMNQFRHLFNTCRIPKREQDHIRCTFKTDTEGESPTHIVVFFRNRMYKIPGVNARTGKILTPPDFLLILKKIVDNAPKSYGESIAALSCLDRDAWADAREHMAHLSDLNKKNLQDIEDAILCFCLDESRPQNYSELYALGMSGPCSNKWCDKSFNYTSTANGGFVATCDHSPFEAMVLIVFVQYAVPLIKRITKEFPKPWKPGVDAGPIKEFVFDLDDKLRDYMRQGLTEYNKFASNLSVTLRMFPTFGKTALKRFKVHPDGFLQICIQLTYMKLYGKPAPTYETATTRGYYRGRTETVRTCTPEAVEFCRAFIDDSPNAPSLFWKAHDKFLWLMDECKKGFGCDRHLMGLALQAAESDESTPAVFGDPAFQKTGGGANFIISSSFTGYSDGIGGVAPMVNDGYGTFYCINNNRMFVSCSTWNSSRKTDDEKFTSEIFKTMQQVYQLIQLRSQSNL